MRLRGDAPRELPDRDRNPVAAIASNERDERVRAAVLALPDDQRSAIALRLWGELEYEQIAELDVMRPLARMGEDIAEGQIEQLAELERRVALAFSTLVVPSTPAVAVEDQHAA